MKKFVIASVLFLFMAVCKSPEKLLQEGNYDAAIDKSVKIILKGKADNGDKALLEKAFLLANQRDQDQARLLIKEDKPENWVEIFKLYTALSSRQADIQKVLPLEINGREFQYKYVDYAPAIVEAKKRAANYFYTKGEDLMAQQNKESYRQAYYNFLKAREYGGSDYPDIEQLIKTSGDLGTTKVLVEIINQSQYNLLPDFYDNVLNINTSRLNSTWVDYDFSRNGNDNEYDFFISIIIENIVISPENFTVQEYLRRKTVQDGYTYELDRRGNIKKDTLGHEIKIPKYKEISCKLIERVQSKSAEIHGEVEFVESNPEQLLLKVPVLGELYFENISGRAIGNFDALEPEDLQLINNGPVPYPDNQSMINDCSFRLQQSVTNVLNSNRELIH